MILWRGGDLILHLVGDGNLGFGISVRLFLGLLFSLPTEEANTQIREVTL
jgi:hypothetical protein